MCMQSGCFSEYGLILFTAIFAADDSWKSRMPKGATGKSGMFHMGRHYNVCKAESR